MSIQVNSGANAVNWETLLGKLGDIQKTTGADGVEKTSVTFTTTVDGVETPVTIAIPDDLELPATVDQSAIDSLCAKLAGDNGLNLSEEQIEQLHESLTAMLKETMGASGSSASKSVMFDLYKLMALLVEVAQKQRDAAREMRQAENEAVQKSILDQAAAQRQAAVTGMIAGAICCAVQIGFTVASLYKQGKAFNTQLGTEKTTGLDVARQNVDMIKAANTQANAESQLAKVKAEVGAKPSLINGQTINGRVDNGMNNAQMRDATAKFNTAKDALQSTTERYIAVKQLGSEPAINEVTADMVAPLEGAEMGPVKTAVGKLDACKADIRAKLDNIANLSDADKQFLMEKGGVEFEKLSIADRARMMNIKMSHMDVDKINFGRYVELKAEVKTAFDGAIGKLENQLAPGGQLKTDLATARENLRAQTKLNLQSFEDSYDNALKEYNETAKTGTSAEKAAASAKLQTAADELKLARATANAKLMSPDLTDAKAHLTDVEEARTKYAAAQTNRSNSVDYLKASHELNQAQAHNSLISAIGGFAQGLVQNWVQYRQAEVTKQGAIQQQQQEELDQTKDLFNQAQNLVDSVVKLMQAVCAAESQSMRDAIQA